MPALAGLSKLSYRRFFIANAISALLWGWYCLLGYFAGGALTQIENSADGRCCHPVILIVVFVVLYRRRRKRNAAPIRGAIVTRGGSSCGEAHTDHSSPRRSSSPRGGARPVPLHRERT